MYCPSLVIDDQYDVICMYMVLKYLANLIKTFNTFKNGINEQFTVLFVGRLIKKKGAKLLVDIAKELSQIQFVLIGNGPEEQYIEKSSKQNKNIHFLGKIKNSELHEFYNSADIFCFPSLYDEGFGRVGMKPCPVVFLWLDQTWGGF